jgi:hypothetical protein
MCELKYSCSGGGFPSYLLTKGLLVIPELKNQAGLEALERSMLLMGFVENVASSFDRPFGVHV